MRQRGRKSSASLSIVPAVSIDARRRPEAPRRLSKEEKAVWREITAALRADWFYAAEHLLEIYVRAIVHERRLADLVKAADPNGPQFAKLVRLQRSEAALIGNLAGKLRLSPRSTFDRYTSKLVLRGPKPWEIGRPPRLFSSCRTFDEQPDGWPSPPNKPAA